MNKEERRRTGKPFCPMKTRIFSLQTPHRRNLYLVNIQTDRRVSLCGLRKGSLTLESALVLPILLCAITALLYLFAFTSAQARAYRTLNERAQVLAVTVGQAAEEDPYIRLYDYQTARLPFSSLFSGWRPVILRTSVRAWVGYTGESFGETAREEMVYVTPDGQVYHRKRDCSYLNLTVKILPFSGLESARNQSGGKYYPCEYCIKGSGPGVTVYITDHGTSYHSTRDCQGLKRTVMAIPYSEAAGMRCCSRCGGAP